MSSNTLNSAATLLSLAITAGVAEAQSHGNAAFIVNTTELTTVYNGDNDAHKTRRVHEIYDPATHQISFISQDPQTAYLDGQRRTITLPVQVAQCSPDTTKSEDRKADFVIPPLRYKGAYNDELTILQSHCAPDVSILVHSGIATPTSFTVFGADVQLDDFKPSIPDGQRTISPVASFGRSNYLINERLHPIPSKDGAQTLFVLNNGNATATDTRPGCNTTAIPSLTPAQQNAFNIASESWARLNNTTTSFGSANPISDAEFNARPNYDPVALTDWAYLQIDSYRLDSDQLGTVWNEVIGTLMPKYEGQLDGQGISFEFISCSGSVTLKSDQPLNQYGSTHTLDFE